MRKKVPKNKYKIIMQDVKNDIEWPYIGRVTFEKQQTFDYIIPLFIIYIMSTYFFQNIGEVILDYKINFIQFIL